MHQPQKTKRSLTAYAAYFRSGTHLHAQRGWTLRLTPVWPYGPIDHRPHIGMKAAPCCPKQPAQNLEQRTDKAQNHVFNVRLPNPSFQAISLNRCTSKGLGRLRFRNIGIWGTFTLEARDLLLRPDDLQQVLRLGCIVPPAVTPPFLSGW